MDKKEFKIQFRERCFRFSLSIIELEQELKSTRAQIVIFNQLVRSATSIGANVVEGTNSTSKKEFINYFQIALKSASETVYWLELLKKTNTTLSLEKLIAECTELIKMLTSIIVHTKKL